MTLEIKLIPSWLVCCKLLHDCNLWASASEDWHLWLTAGLFICMQLRTRKDTESTDLLGQVWMVMKRALEFTGARDPVPVLPAESKACPGMGWRMGIEVVIHCAQPDGWKITSVKPNVECFLSGGGSEGSHIRSLWSQHLAPDRSGVVWFSLRPL